MTQSASSDANSRVLQTFARCLGPLVRLLIARGITFQMASEVLKRTYVQTAKKEFASEDATGSRLSLLTGLNRKEVKRLTEHDDAKTPESMTSFAAAVHSHWRAHRRFRDGDGKPKPLPRRLSNALGKRAITFDDLVRAVTRDVRSSAILDEMVRLQVVEVDANEVVRLIDAPFLSRRELTDRLVHLNENLTDHANAIVTNVLTDPPPFLERSVFADELSPASAAVLAARAREHWQVVHDDLIERAIALEGADAREARAADTNSGSAVKTPSTRIRVGMYFYSESE